MIKFLGTSDNDLDFAEKYTRCSFKQKPEEELTEHEKRCWEEYLKDKENYREAYHIDGRLFTNEISVKLVHCKVCDKIHFNNAHLYCGQGKCPYYVSLEVKEEYFEGGK